MIKEKQIVQKLIIKNNSESDLIKRAYSLTIGESMSFFLCFGLKGEKYEL